jgi:hypothetical protein
MRAIAALLALGPPRLPGAMMTLRYGVRTAVLACSSAIVLLAGCGSSTSPSHPYTPAVAAEFFDSIYAANIAAGTAADSGVAYDVAYGLEPFPAFGGARQTLTVTTASGTQSWFGFASDFIYASGDSEYYTVAYSDNDLTNVLYYVAEFYTNGDSTAYADLEQDNFATETEDSIVTSFTGSVNSLGSSCSLQTGLQADSIIGREYANYPCTSASISNSISFVFPAGAGLGALESWSIPNTTFSGGRFVEGGASRVGLLPPRLAATLARMRARAHARGMRRGPLAP